MPTSLLPLTSSRHRALEDSSARIASAGTLAPVGTLAKAYPLFVLLILSLAFATSNAVDITFGDVRGRLDFSVAQELSLRTQSADKRLVCVANGGTAHNCNFDDGTLNFKQGVASRELRVTGELELNWRSFSLFTRLQTWRDLENFDGALERTTLSEAARDEAYADMKLMDFAVQYDWRSEHAVGDIRVGRHTINWGVSRFFASGINFVNPLVLSGIREAGSNFENARRPVNLLSTRIDFNENLSAEAFYQLDWHATELDPAGTFFSPTDIAGTGATRYRLGFGTISDLNPTNPGVGGMGQGGRIDPQFMSVPRDADVNAKDSGQYGLALKLFVPPAQGSTLGVDLGFYFANYHSRLPVVSVRTGNQQSGGEAVAAAVAGACFAGVQAACPLNILFTQNNTGLSRLAGTAAGNLIAAEDTTAAALTGIVAASNSNANDLVPIANVAQDYYGQSSRYFLEYPENIKLFGFSLNSTLNSNTTVHAEFAHHRRAPLQVDDAELFIAASSPLADLNAALLDNQLTQGSRANFESTIPGYIRRNISHVVIGIDRHSGPSPIWDRFLATAEFGLQHVHNMPSKSQLRLEAPGTDVSGNPRQALLPGVDPALPIGGAHAGIAAQDADDFADATAWGYRLLAAFEVNDAFANINLQPRVAWQHDVSGTSPLPYSTFVEGRKALTLGLGATYQFSWNADLSYTSFMGAGGANLLRDRDFVQLKIKYTF